MNRDRLIQLIALIVMIASISICGGMLPGILDMSQENTLRYTDQPVEGAPPIVVLGTSIGALRGIIVDYLWLKVNSMKDRGLYYEAMADADLITKLQPRFAQVWIFHGHNLIYNISVATNTQAERWEWVKAGIDLVRNEGLRKNPSNLYLHKELAFFFAHKIEGVSDDAHLYYKRRFCRDWHLLLGDPPDDWAARTEWMERLAAAPESIDEATRKNKNVSTVMAMLTDALGGYEQLRAFEANEQFLGDFAIWEAVRFIPEDSVMLSEWEDLIRGQGVPGDQHNDRRMIMIKIMNEIARDPELVEALELLVQTTRKRVLLDEYNMDPELMYEFTREMGPVDWRTAQAHSLYWVSKGARGMAELRVASEDDIYKIVNNDRLQLQAMQGLARWGRLIYDPVSDRYPIRLPEPRWVEGLDEAFRSTYNKHKETRGWGSDTYNDLYTNFLSDQIRYLYRLGEHDKAQRWLDKLNGLFGSGSRLGKADYTYTLEEFVQEWVQGEYRMQAHMAPSEVRAAMEYAFRVGIGQNRPKVFEDASRFCNIVIAYFRQNSDMDYDNKFGQSRTGDMMTVDVRNAMLEGFVAVMRDSGIAMDERSDIYLNTQIPNPFRQYTYDGIVNELRRQFAGSPYAKAYAFEDLFPEPPGMAEFRVRRDLALAEAARLQREQGGDADLQRRGGGLSGRN